MKLTYTLEYTELVTPPRCRKPRPQNGKCDITVTIREVPAQSAPVAFIVSEFDREARKVRLFNGKLWRQVQDWQKQYKETGAYDKSHPFWVNVAEDGFRPYIRNSGGHYDRKYNEWVYPTVEMCKKYARGVASNHIIVDGEAYEKTGEPYYCVACFGLGNNHGGTGFFVGWVYTGERKTIWGMRADDKCSAIERTVEIALNRGDTESEDIIRNTPYDIQVFMPECIKRRYKME